jgi:site-specific DNA-methyltransferase (adenine-specific)
MINLMLGDCLERMKEIAGGSVDMILTDPPYGTTACKWDSVIPLDLMWGQIKRIIKPNGAIVLTAAQPFASTLILSNIKEFKYELIWKKNSGSGFAIAKIQPLKYHENIVIFGGGKILYNPQPTKRLTEASIKATKKPIQGNSKKSEHVIVSGGVVKVQYNPENKYPESVLPFDSVPNGGGKKLHPTQKPVALMEYLIKTYTNENETVLDFTMGSGTTGVACINTNRNFIGIEMDENYFAIAKERIEKAQNEPK